MAGFARAAARQRPVRADGQRRRSFAEALALVGLRRPGRVYWAGRATLVRRPEDIARLRPGLRGLLADRADHDRAGSRCRVAPPLTLALDDGDDGPDVRRRGRRSGRRRAGRALLGRRGPAPPGPVRPHRGGVGRGPAADLRARRRGRAAAVAADPAHPAAVATAIRTCGAPCGATCAPAAMPIRRAWRAPVDRPRRLVLLLDVSGSMEPYARGLARFAHAAVGVAPVGPGGGLHHGHPADPHHPGAGAGATPTPPWPSAGRVGRATGRAAPGSGASLAGVQRPRGACGAWPGARSS